VAEPKPETIPVRDAHRFDEHRLGDWLRPKGLGNLTGVTQFPGGQSNPTFLLTMGDAGELVMRKQPPGKLLPSAHAIDREFRVLSALGKTDVPVPKALAFCEDREVIGTPFFVMERKRGRVLRRNDLPDVPKEERRAIFAAMAETLAKLHAVDPAAVGLADYGKPGGYYARQVATWTRQWESAKPREVPALASLAAWLPQNLPGDDEVRIAHGDFRLENLLYHPSEPQVIAILDWELSTLGPPLGDLGYNVIPWYMPPVPKVSGLAGLDLVALGIPAAAEHVKTYAAAAKRDASELEPFHLAFALFRLAAILEGVLFRARAGNAAAADAEAMGQLGELCANTGWSIAQKGL
jgi:aminoglycoside phosphotransferase (APT) family kinase protein